MPSALELIADLDQLAAFLGYSDYEAMKGLLYPSPLYATFEVPKRRGGSRVIDAPARKLKDMQRIVATDLTAAFGNSSPVAHSFMPGRSVISNALPHVHRASVVRVDLKDFFHQINFGRVKGVFLGAPFSLPDDVATVLSQLCCYDGRLPQGAPTSPALSNYVCRSLDSELRRLAKRYKARYTRYSDDLTFSFASVPIDKLPKEMFLISRNDSGQQRIEPGISLTSTIRSQGFAINDAKTHGAGRDRRQMVTGIVVNDRLKVPGKFVQEVRRALHLWDQLGIAPATDRAVPVLSRKHFRSGAKPSLPKLLRGKLAWLGRVNGRTDEQYQRLARQFNALVLREGLIDLQVVIEPRVKTHAEAMAATWFVRAEVHEGGYDLIEGTAFKVDGQEWVTCAHCVGDMGKKAVFPSVRLYANDGSGDEISARVAKIDWHRDIAILRPRPMVPVPRHLAYFAIADYSPEPPTVVGVMGFPSSNEGQRPIFLRARVVRSRGVSGVQRVEIDKPLLQGNSGGPVFDEDYRVVGVVVEGATVTAGMNSCVAASEINDMRAR